MEIFWKLSLLVNWMHSQVSPSPPGSWGRLGDAGWSSAGPSGAAGRPAQRCAAAAGTPHAGSDGPWPSVLEDSKCTDTPCCSWRNNRNRDTELITAGRWRASSCSSSSSCDYISVQNIHCDKIYLINPADPIPVPAWTSRQTLAARRNDCF